MSTDGQPDPAEIAANRARGQMLAQIPMHLGYQPGPTDVILMARLASSRTTEFIHARWDEAALDPTHAADDVVNKLRGALGDRSGLVEPVTIGAITYGDEHDAARRLHAIITAAEGTISNLDSVTVYQVDGDQRWRLMTADITGDWWAMPGLPVDPLVAGVAAPAALQLAGPASSGLGHPDRYVLRRHRDRVGRHPPPKVHRTGSPAGATRLRHRSAQARSAA